MPGFPQESVLSAAGEQFRIPNVAFVETRERGGEVRVGIAVELAKGLQGFQPVAEIGLVLIDEGHLEHLQRFFRASRPAFQNRLSQFDADVARFLRLQERNRFAQGGDGFLRVAALQEERALKFVEPGILRLGRDGSSKPGRRLGNLRHETQR